MAQQRFIHSPEFEKLSITFTQLMRQRSTTSITCQRAFKLTTKQAVWVASWNHMDDADQFWMIHTAWKCAFDRLPKGGRRIARRNRKRHAR